YVDLPPTSGAIRGNRSHRSRTPIAYGIEALRPLLIARGEQGSIRRGHGDLHHGNIAVLEDEPVAFGALEFRSHYRVRRSALRFGIPADGSARIRSSRGRQSGVERLLRRGAPGRGL